MIEASWIGRCRTLRTKRKGEFCGGVGPLASLPPFSGSGALTRPVGVPGPGQALALSRGEDAPSGYSLTSPLTPGDSPSCWGRGNFLTLSHPPWNGRRNTVGSIPCAEAPISREGWGARGGGAGGTYSVGLGLAEPEGDPPPSSNPRLGLALGHDPDRDGWGEGSVSPEPSPNASRDFGPCISVGRPWPSASPFGAARGGQTND